MNHITQHRPAFFTGFDNEEVDFNTTEELLAIPFVKSFSTDRRFHRYSVSVSPHGNTIHLMCELDDGYEWWCVGRLLNMEGITLPHWEEKYKEEKKIWTMKP